MARYNAMKEYFEAVELLGKPALFTEVRIEQSTVPQSLQLYEIRHDDDEQGDAVQIARNILVNHLGSVILRDEIELPDDGFLDIEPTDLNYGTDDCFSVEAFMAKYPPQAQ